MSAFGISRAVVDEFNGVGPTGVLGLCGVMKIRYSFVVQHDVFQHRAVFTGGSENGGFVLFGEVDELGITSTFEVEYAVGAPSMLVIADERSLRVGRKRGFSGTGEPEEDGCVFPGGVG